MHGIAVGTLPAIARIVLDHEGHSRAHDSGKTAEDEVGVTPAHNLDEERCERRHHERADTNSADGNAGRKTAAPDEPSLHCAHGGNVGAADAKSDAKPIRRVDAHQAVSRARDSQARPGQDHSSDSQPARAPPIGERAAHDPEAEVETACQREHE